MVGWERRRGSAWQAAEALKLLKMLLTRAVDAEAIGRNPVARIRVPKRPITEMSRRISSCATTSSPSR
jgi:hypothetical protein